MATFADAVTISNDATFQGRCLYALTVAAQNVMSESNLTTNHAERTSFAREVLAGGIAGKLVAFAVLTNPTIFQEANAQQLSTGAGVPDGDIQFTINSLFNSLAGIGT